MNVDKSDIMSDTSLESCLPEYIKVLEESAEPSENDKRHSAYTQYINAFLRHFPNKSGLCESAHLVGSTAEQLKLTCPTDEGDTDFIFCSGQLEIPVENLIPRSKTPCFVRIKGDNLNVKCTLVNGEHLPSDILRDVNPILFTFLRGIYLVVTCTNDAIPGRETRVTTTGIDSKVGLARTEFRALQVPDGLLTKEFNLKLNKMRTARSLETHMRLKENKKTGGFNVEDMEALRSILQLVDKNWSTGSKRRNIGQFAEFANAVHDVLQRQKADEDDEEDIPVVFVNDLDATSSDDECVPNPAKKRKIIGMSPPSRQATYESKTSKDFVPAIKIVGRLKCLEDWRSQHRLWPCDKDADDITNSDVYVVSKYAPIEPDFDADFCLSFNQAEVKLAKCMSPVQRKVMLVLKCYLKGFYTEKHNEKNRKLELTTFHMKTALYRMSQHIEQSFWIESNILTAIDWVMTSLLESLKAKRLDHFFIESNLFAGIADDDIRFLIECTETVIAHPIESIRDYLKLGDVHSVKMMLSEDEVMSLLDISSDGGQSKHADAIENAMIDFQRGFNNGPRDTEGKPPIAEALAAIWQVFTKLEFQKVASGGLPSITIPNSLPPMLSPLLGLFGISGLGGAQSTQGKGKGNDA